MKKTILFFILCIVAFTGIKAQNLILLDKNNNEISNDTLVVNGFSSDNILKAEVFLKNDTGEDIQVWLTKTDDYLLPGSLSSFCWNHFCFSPDVTNVEEPLLLGAGQISTGDEFYGEYRPQGQAGSSFVTFEFYPRDEAFPNVKVVVHYETQQPTSSFLTLREPVMSPPQPNPAANFTSFDYHIPGNINNAVLIVRDLTGRIVMEVPVSKDQNRMQLNVSNLNNGVFLYSLFLDGKPVLTKKLIVSR
jgi:hypothetical protein